MRTIRTRRPKSISLSACTTLARLAGFSSGATASSRSMQMESAALAAAFGIIAGRDAGTNNMLRVKRTGREVRFNILLFSLLSSGSGSNVNKNRAQRTEKFERHDSETPGHTEHVLANVRQDQVR